MTIESLYDCIFRLETLIIDLGGNIPSSEEESPKEEKTTDEDEGIVVPIYDTSSGAEDYDTAADCKTKASVAKDSGDYKSALEWYNKAVVSAPPSALLYSNRAICLQKLGHYKQAQKDCNLALDLNPDSCKALKTRGKLRYKHLQDWKGALSDLSQAQSIDFDPELAETLKELTKQRVNEEKKEAKERIAKEEKLRKRAEEIKKMREEEAKEAKYQRDFEQNQQDAGMQSGFGDAFDDTMGGMGGIPGMSGMPGMPGMPGDMGSIMSMFLGDPEIQQAMKNPKVLAAFSELMASPGGPSSLLSDPSKMERLMSDPEVGPVLQKIMSKLGGVGMGGPMGGPMPSDDEIPDLGDLPDLD